MGSRFIRIPLAVRVLQEHRSDATSSMVGLNLLATLNDDGIVNIHDVSYRSYLRR